MIAEQDCSIPMCLKRFGNSKQGCLGKPVSDAQWDKIIAVFEDCLADEIVQTIDDRYGWIDLILRRLGRRPYLLGAGAGPAMKQDCKARPPGPTFNGFSCLARDFRCSFCVSDPHLIGERQISAGNTEAVAGADPSPREVPIGRGQGLRRLVKQDAKEEFPKSHG